MLPVGLRERYDSRGGGRAPFSDQSVRPCRMKTARTSERPKQKSRPQAGRRLRGAARTPRQQVVVAVAVVILFVLAGYANSLSNGFVFDDKSIILDNRLLRSL